MWLWAEPPCPPSAATAFHLHIHFIFQQIVAVSELLVGWVLWMGAGGQTLPRTPGACLRRLWRLNELIFDYPLAQCLAYSNFSINVK